LGSCQICLDAFEQNRPHSGPRRRPFSHIRSIDPVQLVAHDLAHFVWRHLGPRRRPFSHIRSIDPVQLVAHDLAHFVWRHLKPPDLLRVV
jgi:hypothetical protein